MRTRCDACIASLTLHLSRGVAHLHCIAHSSSALMPPTAGDIAGMCVRVSRAAGSINEIPENEATKLETREGGEGNGGFVRISVLVCLPVPLLCERRPA